MRPTCRLHEGRTHRSNCAMRTTTFTMHEGSALEVLRTFLKLGVTSFGGPVAHIAYFREEIVVRRRWVDDAAYTDLVALCQFLPGPASSQVGFALGLIRAGYWGGLAAWAGFTMPSAVLMVAFSFGAGAISDAAISAALLLSCASSLIQMVAIGLGCVLGLLLCRSPSAATLGMLRAPVSRGVGILSLSLFFGLLAVLPFLVGPGLVPAVALFDAFYRTGALLFGGGHVVLPLLHDAVVTPGWVNDNSFLAGYGAAQAMPGPLFTFAAYQGAVAIPQSNGIVGATLALVGIFLPGILLLIGEFSECGRDSNSSRDGLPVMLSGRARRR